MTDDRKNSGYDRILALAQNDPDQFRRLIEQVKDKVVYPHAAQQVVLDSNARFRIMNCGRRWGKTVLAAKILVSKTRQARKTLWWIAPTYKVVKRGYAEVLRQLPDGVLTHSPPPESNFDAGRAVILRFKNGTKIEFYSAERPEGMLGEGVDFAVMDEAAIMPSRIWNQIVSPTLIDRLGGALMISTPRGKNWFYRTWQMGQDPLQPDFESWTFPSSSNPTLPEGEVERMRGQMPRMEYEQEVEAKFVAAGSSVFVIPDEAIQPGYPYENGLIEGCPPQGFVVLGIDLAKTNDYTVLYGCNARNRRNCYFRRFNDVTWPEQKRRIRSAVALLLRKGANGVMLMMDSTGVGDPIVEDMEIEGYDVVGLNFTTHKANMVKLLSKDLEEAQAFIMEDFKEEFQSYSMAMTEGGRIKYGAPEGEHDDVVSAKMLSHWGCVNEGVPEVQVISAAAPVQSERPSEDNDLYAPENFDDYSDLLDDESAAMEEVGLAPTNRRPTPQELLAHEELWF
jgi:hypothetical protein